MKRYIEPSKQQDVRARVPTLRSTGNLLVIWNASRVHDAAHLEEFASCYRWHLRMIRQSQRCRHNSRSARDYISQRFFAVERHRSNPFFQDQNKGSAEAACACHKGCCFGPSELDQIFAKDTRSYRRDAADGDHSSKQCLDLQTRGFEVSLVVLCDHPGFENGIL